MAEMKPTPKPAIRRPTTIKGRAVEAVWRMQPTEKTPHPEMIVHRRPMWSAKSPAMMAPKKVPQERILVRRDCWDDGKTKALTAAASLGSGYGRPVYRCLKYGIPMILNDVNWGNWSTGLHVLTLPSIRYRNRRKYLRKQQKHT